MKKVQILLSTYNGEKYIKDQIESLQKQKGIELSILVRDDGSTDSTTKMLSEWQDEGILKWYQGKNLGPAKSFMNLVCNSSEADYYAFCDQDDVWEEDKVLRAIEKLEKNSSSKPSMYFSKAQLVNENLVPVKNNKYPKRAYTFGEALIKNNCTGCTMVFNRMLLEIIKKYQPSFLTMHDYWIYLVCLSIGGTVIYDEKSYIKYRQHNNNVVGGKRKIIKEYCNKYMMLVNRCKDRSKLAKELKYGYYSLMPDENRLIIDKVTYYDKSIKYKLKLIFDKNIKTNTLWNNILFIIAVLFEAF